MLHARLLNYIHSGLAAGLEPAVMHRNLLAAGWKESDVVAALARISSEWTESENVFPTATKETSPELKKGTSFWRMLLLTVLVILAGILIGQIGFMLIASHTVKSVTIVPSSTKTPATTSTQPPSLLSVQTNTQDPASSLTPLSNP